MTDTLRLRHDGSLRTILLHRSDHRNALTSVMLQKVVETLEQVNRDPEARLLVIGADGVDFCTGLDLDEFYGSASAEDAAVRADTDRIAALLRALDACTIPSVALVQGRAYGIGATLALSCDVILASSSTSFAFPEVQYGFLPAFAAARLGELIGRRRALELLATGRTLGAEEARELGLVSRVIPEEGFHAVTGSCLRVLGSAGDALVQLKQLYREIEGMPFDQALAVCAEASLRARRSATFREAAAQFLSMTR